MFTASNEVGIPVIAQREHNFFTIPKQSACSVKKSTDLASKDVVPGVLSRKLGCIASGLVSPRMYNHARFRYILLTWLI